MLTFADSHVKDLLWNLIKIKVKLRKVLNPLVLSILGVRSNHILQRENIEEELSNKDDILVSGTNDVTQNEVHGILTGVQADLHQLQEDTPWLYQWICQMDMTFQTGLVLIKELGRQM